MYVWGTISAAAAAGGGGQGLRRGEPQHLHSNSAFSFFLVPLLPLSAARRTATGCVEFAMPLIDARLLRLARGQCSFPQRGAIERRETQKLQTLSAPSTPPLPRAPSPLFSTLNPPTLFTPMHGPQKHQGHNLASTVPKLAN